MSRKAVSYEERLDRIRTAIYRAALSPGLYDDNLYVEYVYDGYAIVRLYGGLAADYLRVSYEESADGAISVQSRDEWQRVEKEWAAKATVIAVNPHAIKKTASGYKGLLVRFSDADAPDLTGDYFDASTDFEIADGQTTHIYYNHGLDPQIKRRKIGTGTLSQDDVGVWVEFQLTQRDDYERAIGQLVEAGKMGLSSGTAAHLVEREPAGKAQHITYWPLGLDASITPTPAEPGTFITSLKSFESTPLQVSQQAAGDAATAATTAVEIPSTPPQEDSSVNEEQIKQFIADALKAHAAPSAPTATADVLTAGQAEAIKSAVGEAVKSAMESAPAVKTAGVEVPAVHVSKGDDRSAAAKAFNAYLHGDDSSATKATLVAGTGANGGFLVPTEYSTEIVTPLRDLSYLRRAGARIITRDNGAPFKVPVQTDSAAAALLAESGAYAQSEPTFAEVTFTPYKLTKMSKASEEEVDDSRFDLWSNILQPDYVQAFAAGENSYFTTGTGVSQPQGVVAGAQTGVTLSAGQTTSITSADSIIDLYFSLDYKYRDNAVFMMNDATLKLVRKLKDTQNRYLWEPGINGNTGGLLLGKPVITNNSMASPAANAKTILFGNFAYFWIADFGQMAVQRLNELYAGNGHVGFRAYKRVDSHVMLANAFQLLVQSAT